VVRVRTKKQSRKSTMSIIHMSITTLLDSQRVVHHEIQGVNQEHYYLYKSVRLTNAPVKRTDALFLGLTASLSSLGKDVWLQLNNEQLRFTVVPEQGSQVWAYVLRSSIWLTLA